MNIIHSLRLKSVGPFKDTTIKIKPGISVIYGLNRSGGPHSKNSNGVGKSFLFSSLSEMLYENPIVGEKQDRIKAGVRAFSYTSAINKKKIVIIRKMKGRSESISVNVDGKDKEFRTSTIAKNYIKKTFPITQEEYNTYIHIDSRIPHPLVMGNSTERKNFFTSFFGLDKLDAERKLYTAELNKLSKIRAVFQELRAQYNRSKEDLLDKEVVRSHKSKIEIYTIKLEKLAKKLVDLQEVIRLTQFAQSSKDQLRVLNIACHNDITTETFEKIVNDNQWDLKKVKSDIEEAESWEQYKRDSQYYQTAISKLSNKASALIAKYSLKEAKVKVEDYIRKYSSSRKEVAVLKDSLEEEENIINLECPKAATFPAEDLADLETLQRLYLNHISHSKRFKHGKCETCGSVIKIKDMSKLQDKLEDIEKKIKRYKLAKQHTEHIALVGRAKSRIKSLNKKLIVAKASQLKLGKWEKIARELATVPQKPRAYQGRKLQLIVLKRMLEEIQERKQLLDFCRPNLESIISFMNLTKEQIHSISTADELNSNIHKLQDKLSALKVAVEVHNLQKDKQNELKTRLIELKEQLQNEEPLKILVQGYQEKNMKKRAVATISTRLMQLVNRYSAQIFPETYRFELKWDTQLSLLVHRCYKGRTLTSDVRKLSGAESTLFTLILVCALMAFVPAYKRCSLMILDEPSARLSSEMTEVFQQILKILNTLIPSIVVITPKSDELYPDAHNYTVVKQDGISRIIEGMPSQVGKT